MVQESMEKVRGKFNEIKAKIDRISHWVLVALLATVCFGAGYACGPRNAGRTDVYDHGNGADAVREQLNRAEDNQRSITDGLQRAADQSGRITSEIDESRGIVQDIAESSADLQAKSTRQEALLTQANQSLMQYAAEEKRTRLRIKSQRNTWEIVAAGLLVAWAAK